MQLKKITIGVAAMVAMAAVGGVALAKSGHGPVSTPKVTSQTSPDTDNVRQGDQTSPDTSSKVRADRTKGGGASTSGSNSGSSASSESESNADPEAESNTESESDSDGPGGHEDPPGNVDHQFEGQE